jgi:hypothetical protein
MNTNLRIRTTAAVGVVTLGLLGGSVAAPALAAHHHRTHHPRHHRHHNPIPQHNRGDMDPDNNGAHSDGDGNI